jgi:hypothetical protein
MSDLRKELAEALSWLCERFIEGDHGCVTGDCPHSKQDECIECLKRDYEVYKKDNQ